MKPALFEPCPSLQVSWGHMEGADRLPTMSIPFRSWYLRLDETPMWVAQVPAFSRMLGGLFWLSKLGSRRCLMASSPFERDVPTIPAAKPTMANTMPCRVQGSMVIKTWGDPYIAAMGTAVYGETLMKDLRPISLTL